MRGRYQFRLTTILLGVLMIALAAALIHSEFQSWTLEKDLSRTAAENARLKEQLGIPVNDGFILQLAKGPVYRFSIGPTTQSYDVALFHWAIIAERSPLQSPPDSAERVDLLTLPSGGDYELTIQIVELETPINDEDGTPCHALLQVSYANLIERETIATSGTFLFPAVSDISYMTNNVPQERSDGQTLLAFESANGVIAIRLEPQ